MRPVDADEAKRIAREYLTDPYHVISAVAVLDKTPTLTQPNELLTLDVLREMDEPTPVWWEKAGCWCLCERGFIIAPNGNIYEFEETDVAFYRRPPEGNDNV